MHAKKADLLERMKAAEIGVLDLVEESIAYFCGGIEKIPNGEVVEKIFQPLRDAMAARYSFVLDMPDDRFNPPSEAGK